MNEIILTTQDLRTERNEYRDIVEEAVVELDNVKDLLTILERYVEDTSSRVIAYEQNEPSAETMLVYGEMTEAQLKLVLLYTITDKLRVPIARLEKMVATIPWTKVAEETD